MFSRVSSLEMVYALSRIELSISDKVTVKETSPTILSQLQVLQVRDLTIYSLNHRIYRLTEPIDLSILTKLRNLTIESGSLRDVLLPVQLKSLQISKLYSHHDLDLSHLTGLENLEVSQINKLPPHLTRLVTQYFTGVLPESLIDLQFSYPLMYSLASLPKNLTRLHFNSNITQMRELEFTQLPRLTDLQCTTLLPENYPSLEALPLRRLSLTFIEDLSLTSYLPRSLQDLTITSVDPVSLPPLPELTSLCYSGPGIIVPRSITDLTLSSKLIFSTFDLSQLQSLKKLSLGFSGQTEDNLELKGLNGSMLTELQVFTYYFRDRTKIDSLLVQLPQVNVLHLPQISSLSQVMDSVVELELNYAYVLKKAWPKDLQRLIVTNIFFDLIPAGLVSLKICGGTYVDPSYQFRPEVWRNLVHDRELRQKVVGACTPEQSDLLMRLLEEGVN